MKIIKITEKLFRTEPLFIFNCIPSEVYLYLKKKFNIEINLADTDEGTVQKFDKSPWRVVWLKNFKGKPEDIGTLVHEITHLCVRICEDKGIPIISNHENGDVGDETLAYMIDYFTVEFLKKWRK